MRILPLFAAAVAVPALADDLPLRADVAAVTVYAAGAEIVRTGTVTVPAGSHRIVVPMPDYAAARGLRAEGLGPVTIGAVGATDVLPIPLDAFDTDAQAAQRREIEALEDDLTALLADIARVEGRRRAAQIRLDYLTGLAEGGDDGVALPGGSEDLVALMATLADQVLAAEADLQDAGQDLRDLRERQRLLQEDLDAARRAFAALTPLPGGVTAATVDVTAAAPTDLTLSLTYLTDAAQWMPAYDLALDTDTGRLDVVRNLVVTQFGPERWTDVDLTVSTADPRRQRAPAEVAPAPARIGPDILVREERDSSGDTSFYASPPSPIAAAPVTAQDTRAVAAIDGLSLTYAYPRPVTLVPQEAARLRLDALRFAVETERRAVPRTDATAFLLATLTNDTAETLVPGRATFLRDGDFLGDGRLPLVAPGAEVEVAFGPIDTLALTYDVRALEEGDAGVLQRMETRRWRVTFTVENTSDAPQEVTALYALPFAEQEDLRVIVETTPAPDRRDVDGDRGVAAWDLTLAPGETFAADLRFSFAWPEGNRLFWSPR